MYWHRLGDLPYKLALQKVCSGNAVALQSLCDEGVVKVIDDMICIDFLNEQLSEFENLSKVNSENARSGWDKRRNNAVAKQSQSGRNAIRGEKIRGEETRYVAPEVFESKETAYEFLSTNFIDVNAQRKIVVHRGWQTVTDNDIKALTYHFLEKTLDLTTKPRDDVRKHFQNWLGKVPVIDLQTIAKEVYEGQRRQRQSAEVRGNGNSV